MEDLDSILRRSGVENSSPQSKYWNIREHQNIHKDSQTSYSSSEFGEPRECPKCKGTGYVMLDVPLGHPQFGKALPCDCKKEEMRLKKLYQLRNMNGVQDIAGYTFESFVVDIPDMSLEKREKLSKALSTCQNFANNPEGWLLILGSYGVGKTHLAAAIANKRFASGKPATFIVAPDLLDHLRSAFNPEMSVSYDNVFQHLRTTELLIVDDLGTQSSTAWAQEKLFQLFNARYNSQLPTVVTSNQRLEDIDQRLRSRLMDMKLVKKIELRLPDYRYGSTPSEIDLSMLRILTDKTFDNFRDKLQNLKADELSTLRRVKRSAMQYAEKPLGWFVMLGIEGVGKTHLAAAIANHWAEESSSDVLFVGVAEFLDYLKSTFNPSSPVAYDMRFEEIKNIPFLVLDDLGMESATPWAREKLFQLLNYRFECSLPTVITSKIPEHKLEPWLSSRINDKQRCRKEILDLPGYRGSKNQIKDKLDNYYNDDRF
ncbi:MAG: ATP-binding protein [Caldilineaceae bacterium]|nr:ATP-binding protein [Caldilineaceae bacterium]